MIVTLVLGISIAAFDGQLDFEYRRLALAQPKLIMPSFSLAAFVGVVLPLFVVTMASQNLPGAAVIRASGYAMPISPVVGWIGVVNLMLAPFGAFALNLAAITAAICMGREAHEEPNRRYVAAVTAGFFYLPVGVSGATVTAVFAAFPKQLVLVIARLARFGTIGNGLASGVALAGIGSAFWGLVAGGIALLLLRTGKR